MDEERGADLFFLRSFRLGAWILVQYGNKEDERGSVWPDKYEDQQNVYIYNLNIHIIIMFAVTTHKNETYFFFI